MTGNVDEWVQDLWVPHLDESGIIFFERMTPEGRALPAEEAARLDRMEAEEAKLPHRTVRGGCWMVPNVDCARRFGLAESRVSIATGFRLVAPLPERGK